MFDDFDEECGGCGEVRRLELSGLCWTCECEVTGRCPDCGKFDCNEHHDEDDDEA